MNFNIIKTLEIKKLVLCLVCCFLTCICAIFIVPIGVIPLTLATFAVYISGTLLGAKYGAMSQILYVILICIGLPFTSNLKGGVNYILGATGGYIVGYILTAFSSGYIYFRFGKRSSKFIKKIFWLFIGLIVGTVFNYILGTTWYCLVCRIDFVDSFSVCVYPFLVFDFLKIAITVNLVPNIEKILCV